MNDVMEINSNVVYVRGATRGALYNFNDGKIYSIDSDACKLIEAYLAGELQKDSFIEHLKEMSLIGDNYTPKKYAFPKPPSELNFVWLELTENCNLRCTHCYVGDMHYDNPNEILSLDQWEDVIRQLKDVKCKRIEFIGGEPTVYPYFEELLEFAVSIGHSVDIYSNLQTFNDKLIDYVKAHDIVVHFSIYGSSSITHDSVTRKNGSFKTLVYWLEKLVKNQVKVIPSVTIMRQNQDDISNIISLLQTMGIPVERMSIDVVRATTRRDIQGLAPETSEKNLALRRKPSFSTTKSSFHRAYYANTCLFGKFSIQPNGVVSPCEFSRDITYGNVKSESIAQILQSDTLKRLWFLDFSKIEQCKECEYRFACQDCRMVNGVDKLYKKNPRCLYNPLLGIWETKSIN